LPSNLPPVGWGKKAGLAVEVGQRQAFDAAFRRGADVRQFHQRRPQAAAVDSKFVH
jgi:hypothetical protein